MGCAEEITLRTCFQNVDKHCHSLTFSLLLTNCEALEVQNSSQPCVLRVELIILEEMFSKNTL